MANEIDVSSITGISEAEAAERLKEEGYNELPTAKPRSIFAIVLGVLREPMFVLLVGGGLIYLFLGDLQEALILLSFVFVVMGITIYQERKTERALEALRDLSSPRALVIRSGKQTRIAGREVVRRDIVVVSEGDRVPADGVVISSTNLMVDESLLTGESVPVRKIASNGTTVMGKPGGDDQPFVYSGTLVVRGRGIARIRATGAYTELGKIGRALRTVTPEDTLLQRETRRLVGLLSAVGLLLFVIVVTVYGFTRGHWVRGLLAGITMAMAVLPEEFPVVLTVFLALGAWRISRRRVLTRHMPAVETLGAATVLCVDKTGTLTQNRMSVAEISAHGHLYDVEQNWDKPLPEEFHELVEYSILASQRDPFDPMEKAIKELGDRFLSRTEHLHANWSLVRQYPLSPELLAMSHVWSSPTGEDYEIAAKGAPEAITDLCHLRKKREREVLRQAAAMAADGLRVLGVARAAFKREALPGEQHEFAFEFLGLVGLADPIRPAVPAAVQESYRAGVRVVMITGDYPETARSIARQIGLKRPDAVITGDELDRLTDGELQHRVMTVDVFARVVPEQKLRLVRALKANDQIAAMTGDGVNDAPALKAADIGIAMGARGTDVARESADMVLLDDDFSSIVKAIRMGRRIYDNLKKATAYILSVHVPIVGMSLLPVLVGWPLVLLPVHIAFLELIIDPACSIVFEAEPAEANVMNRPPRDPKEPLYGRRTIGISVLQGLSVLAAVLVMFATSHYGGQSENESRTLAFTTLIVANLGLILVNRSWSRVVVDTLRSPNPALWVVIVAALIVLMLVLYIPTLRDLFRFTSLAPRDLALCFGAGIAGVLWFEVLKAVTSIRGRRTTAGRRPLAA